MDLLILADPGLATEANALALSARREGFGVMAAEIPTARHEQGKDAAHGVEVVEAIHDANVVVGLVPGGPPHVIEGWLALAVGLQVEAVLWAVAPLEAPGAMALPQVWHLAGPVAKGTERAFLSLLDVLELKLSPRVPSPTDWRRLARNTTARLAQQEA